MDVVLDDYHVRNLPPQERFDKICHVLKTSDDESLRVDSVWLLSEMLDFVRTGDSLYEKISDMLVWILKNDHNGVVKHEAAFEIGARNLRKKIPELIEAATCDDDVLVRHESLEGLGLMKTDEFKETIRVCLEDPAKEVRETAMFVLKRMERIKNNNIIKT